MRIRDAVSGDISLNSLEEYCLRQPAFQRLHRLKQLGNAFHAYPSATHTRLAHSLGVSHQIKKLLAQTNFFPRKYRLGKNKKMLIELSGLLHDITHTPFKHTLDRDAAILPEPKIELEYRYRLEQINLHKRLGEDNIRILLGILANKDPLKSSEPYLGQIIEDTISADLLDYSLRDAYYTAGWRMQWDERIYDHISVSLYNNKPHLVANLLDRNGKITQSAITELINLLQIRYMLNERVYFYPIKTAADALLVKSIRCLIQSSGKKTETIRKEFRDKSDEEMINDLASSKYLKTRKYAKHLKDRALPRLVHAFKSSDLLPDVKNDIANCCRGFSSLERWRQCEEEIEKEARVGAGTIIIYCHDPEMQKKEPNFLVQTDKNKEPQPVENNSEMKDDISIIGNKHKNLWRCYIFSLDRSSNALKKIKPAAVRILKDIKNVSEAKQH